MKHWMQAPVGGKKNYLWVRLTGKNLMVMSTQHCLLKSLKDLPVEAWQYIKEQGFLGLIIPKEYGGRAFSSFAQSRIMSKISSRSLTTAVSCMVPNSLGPGELLLHYGTEEQKNTYLPKLIRSRYPITTGGTTSGT